MHAYPSKMRKIGNRLNTVAGDARDDVTAAVDDTEAAGAGNEGLSTVAQAAATSTAWLDHVRAVAGRMETAGDGLITSADDIEGTDLDNERYLPTLPDISPW